MRRVLGIYKWMKSKSRPWLIFIVAIILLWAIQSVAGLLVAATIATFHHWDFYDPDLTSKFEPIEEIGRAHV